MSMKPVSFKLASKKRKAPVGNVQLDSGDSEVRVSVSSLDQKSLTEHADTKKKREIKAIPLIHKNEWRAAPPSAAAPSASANGGDSGEGTDNTGEKQGKPNGNAMEVEESNGGEANNAEEIDLNSDAALTKAAVDVLLKGGDGDDEKEIQAVPLLVQNKVPGIDDVENDEEKFKLDLAMRPEEASLDDYESMPVEDFGKAMLFGMGWKPGAAIGGKNKAVCKPTEFQARGHRLGLGATEMKTDPAGARKRIAKPGEKRETDEEKKARLVPTSALTLREGARVEIIGGKHKRLGGVVTLIEDRKVSIKLSVNQEVVRCYKEDIRLLADGETEPSSAGSSRGSESKDKKHKKKDRDRSRSRERSKDKRRYDSDDRSRRDSERDAKKKKKQKKEHKISWVSPNLRVTIVSKSLDGGRHYAKKGRVVDIVDRYYFSMIMDGSGRMVEDVSERNVETCVPKPPSGVVKILHGAHKGELATVIERSRSTERVAVQTKDDLELLTLSFDDVCEYVGAF